MGGVGWVSHTFFIAVQQIVSNEYYPLCVLFDCILVLKKCLQHILTCSYFSCNLCFQLLAYKYSLVHTFRFQFKKMFASLTCNVRSSKIWNLRTLPAEGQSRLKLVWFLCYVTGWVRSKKAKILIS